MARTRSSFLDPKIATYCGDKFSQPDEVQLELEKVTSQVAGPLSRMQIGDDQAVLMEIIARSIGATRAVEVGTFTGSSALAVAKGMGPSGKLLCLDINTEWTDIARKAWGKAGVSERIELKIGPAIDTLRELGEDVTFDLAFVDADKTGYLAYYEEIIPRLRPGGLLLADNTLQDGQVCDLETRDADVLAIKEFNVFVASDRRVKSVLLPFADGLTIAQRI